MKLVANEQTWEFKRAALFRPIEAIAFWAAIALPFLHVPLLLYGLETTGQLVAFLSLLLLNVLALLIGHGYNR